MQCTLLVTSIYVIGHIMVHAMYVIGYIMRACNVMYVIIIIYYSWNGGRAEAVCAGGKGVRMR